jgi:hypothetical protein
MNSMLLKEFVDVLVGKSLEDVLVAGFVEKESQQLRFCANYRNLYFDCGGLFVKASVVRSEGVLTLNVISDPAPEQYDDDDLVPAISSIRDVVLLDPNGSNLFTSIHLWNAQEGVAGIASAALRLDLSNGQQIFIDPSYYFGMRIGGTLQEQIWSDGFRRPEWTHIEMPLQGNQRRGDEDGAGARAR